MASAKQTYDAKRLREALQATFPGWLVAGYSRKECAATNMFDPPCAYVEVRCRLGAFTVTTVGEVYTDKDNWSIPPPDTSTTLGKAWGKHRLAAAAVRTWVLAVPKQ